MMLLWKILVTWFFGVTGVVCMTFWVMDEEGSGHGKLVFGLWSFALMFLTWRFL